MSTIKMTNRMIKTTKNSLLNKNNLEKKKKVKYTNYSYMTYDILNNDFEKILFFMRSNDYW